MCHKETAPTLVTLSLCIKMIAGSKMSDKGREDALGLMAVTIKGIGWKIRNLGEVC